jgi:G3E family GTPase
VTTNGEVREVVPEFVLLTGSLGSGKTTLLCDYLSLPESTDTGVIVNEAGEINVDGAIVASGRRDLPMALLSNGCVCCSLGDDLHSAIDELIAVRRRSGASGFRRIVLETSGLAMPGPILRSLMRYDRVEYRLRIVSTLDVLDPMNDEAMFPVRSAQLTAAKSIVMTKLDRGGYDYLAAAERRAKEINPAATRISVVDRHARAKAVFAPGQIDTLSVSPSAFQAIAATNHSRLKVFLANWIDPVPWTDLGDWLEDIAGFCGDRLLRVKGLVAVVGVPEPILIDGVGTTFAEPRLIGPGPLRAQGLVIIARDMDLAELMAFSAASPAGVRPDLRNSLKSAA